MRLSVRMEVHWEDVSCRLSADVVGKGRPRPADLTGRERRVRSSNEIMEGVDPPRSEERNFLGLCLQLGQTVRIYCRKLAGYVATPIGRFLEGDKDALGG